MLKKKVHNLLHKAIMGDMLTKSLLLIAKH